jgi:hypothetical protein
VLLPSVLPFLVSNKGEKIFRHNVFKMMLSKGNITQELADMLMSWRHSGFNVYCGPRIQPGDEQAMENLARYITRGASACAARPRLCIADRRGFFSQSLYLSRILSVFPLVVRFRCFLKAFYLLHEIRVVL